MALRASWAVRLKQAVAASEYLFAILILTIFLDELLFEDCE